MANFFKKHLYQILLVGLPLIGTFLILTISVKPAKALLSRTAAKGAIEQKELINFVAIGDSLTEGVGDTTNSGGYVPLLKRDLETATNTPAMTAFNFGKAGNRSEQVLKRIKSDKEIKVALQRADFINLTVGGNDLMKVIRGELLNDINEGTFAKPLAKYQANLTDLIAEIREYAPTAPIYLLGIYNPFYMSFKEIKEMQAIVNLWNNGSEEIINQTDNAYFIPINDSLYRGLDGKVGIGTSDGDEVSEEELINNLISDQDNFHPNNLGYQIIANAFKDKLLQTKTDWLKK